MRRTRKILATGLAAATVAALASTSASAEDLTVTAALTNAQLGGTRVLSTIGALTLSNLSGTTLDTPMSVSVVETLVPGKSPWSVTAAMTAPLTGSTTSAVIASDNLKIGGCSVTDVLSLIGSGVTTTSLSTPAALSSPQTLFSVTGEQTGTMYTNTYSCTPTLSLTLPTTFEADTYTGTLTVTLVQ